MDSLKKTSVRKLEKGNRAHHEPFSRSFGTDETQELREGNWSVEQAR